jgi:hypothetical protein
MPAHRANPNRIKLHRCYTASELAARCGVHKNTVTHWRKKGLEPIDESRPILFQGATIREFLTKRNRARKCPCSPGRLYCLRCRQPRAPALGMVEYIPINDSSGNLRALCECCEAMMHRRVRRSEIGNTMPGFFVELTQRQPSLSGRASPSLNCDSGK